MIKFLTFINRELAQFNEIFSKNENIFIIYENKQKRFGKSKYNTNLNNVNTIENKKDNNNIKKLK